MVDKVRVNRKMAKTPEGVATYCHIKSPDDGSNFAKKGENIVPKYTLTLLLSKKTDDGKPNKANEEYVQYMKKQFDGMFQEAGEPKLGIEDTPLKDGDEMDKDWAKGHWLFRVASKSPPTTIWGGNNEVIPAGDSRLPERGDIVRVAMNASFYASGKTKGITLYLTSILVVEKNGQSVKEAKQTWSDDIDEGRANSSLSATEAEDTENAGDDEEPF